MTAVQPSKVDMCRLLSDQPVGAIEYIDKEVNVKEFDWDYWQLHRCEKTTLVQVIFFCFATKKIDFILQIQCKVQMDFDIKMRFNQ